MHRFKARGLPVLVALLSVAAFAGNKSSMQSWVGQTESELISAWGAPTRTMQLADGTRVHTWESPYGKNGQRLCRQSFTIDSDGRIVSFSLQGCPP